jgi:hypothetical protein
LTVSRTAEKRQNRWSRALSSPEQRAWLQNR